MRISGAHRAAAQAVVIPHDQQPSRFTTGPRRCENNNGTYGNSLARV